MTDYTYKYTDATDATNATDATDATATTTATTNATSATSTTHPYSTTHTVHSAHSHYPPINLNLTLTRSNGEYIPHTPHQYTTFPHGIIHTHSNIRCMRSALQNAGDAGDNLIHGDIASYTSTSIEFAMHQPGNK